MLVSLVIIIKFIVPQIIAGQNPLFISIVGALLIMTITLYLAHGFSKKTTIALISTFLSFTIAGLVSVIFVKLSNLSGLGSEDAYSLRFGQTEMLNFKGLFLGGIMIGALGVLDDITTSLSASIFEIKEANPKISPIKLVKSGMTIGTEHISSLVNTLVLAYAGASLPIFLFIVINPSSNPLWLLLNSEMIVEEIVRTVSGSIALVAAVPITTVLASWATIEFSKKNSWLK